MLPTTQSIRIRWRPELRFYEQRILILRSIEAHGLLQAFRVSEESVDAEFPDWQWLSVRQDGLTLNVLSETSDVGACWELIRDLVIEKLAPLSYSRIRVSYQHVLPLSLSFEEAISRSQSLFPSLRSTHAVMSDWALLADLDLLEHPSSKGQIEVGIVRNNELPMRLTRVGDRAPGMRHLGQRRWEPEAFKDVSLFADSDLTFEAQEGSEFLDEAIDFWTISRDHVGRLLEDLGNRLSDSKS